MDDRGGSRSERQALETWIAATWHDAVAYARSLVHHDETALDLVHDCYCRLLQKSDVYDLLRDGMKLLIKSITNASINFASRRRATIALDPDGACHAARSRTLIDWRESDPSQAAMDHELELAVAAGLRRLPHAQRAALEMKSLGYSLIDIAEALETTPANAGTLVYRARRFMAVSLRRFLPSAESRSRAGGARSRTRASTDRTMAAERSAASFANAMRDES